MEISNRERAKEISFRAKFQPQILFRGRTDGEPMERTKQNGPVENDEQRKDEKNPDAATTLSFRLRVFVLIIRHERFTLWIALERATGRVMFVHCAGPTFAARLSRESRQAVRLSRRQTARARAARTGRTVDG
jgi:hypothetical protein